MAGERAAEMKVPYDTISDVRSYTSFSYNAYSVKTTVLGRALEPVPGSGPREVRGERSFIRPQQGQLSGVYTYRIPQGPTGLQTIDLRISVIVKKRSLVACRKFKHKLCCCSPYWIVAVLQDETLKRKLLLERTFLCVKNEIFFSITLVYLFCICLFICMYFN